MEIWKPVPRYPGMLASSEGRILFPPCYAPLHQGGYRLYAPEPTLGSETRARAGAAHVYLSAYNKALGRVKVHQAVCEAFHGVKPFDDAVVIHLDENALNNRPENLKWGTQKENLSAPGFRKFRSSEMARINRSRVVVATGGPF